MADIFLSYKRERRAAVAHLAEVLKLYGYSVWYDYGLETGGDFGVQIERELRTAKAAVVLWCSLSRDSRWVRQEATLA
nr:toll/interleukin-1 receptor domain-containing protein [Paracoccaceae bacterium]